LMLPTWMYAKSGDSLFVNLYIGSTVRVGRVGDTEVEMVQHTDYPWKGDVKIVVNPAAAKAFTVRLRAPNRNPSTLYRCTPDSSGIERLSVNGIRVVPEMVDGYATVTRPWKRGDVIEMKLPLLASRVKADDRIAADRGRVALRYGPLVYNLESVDQNVESVLKPESPLRTKWNPDLLGGVVTIHSVFADDSPMTAIPNYARNNRGGRSMVWIKSEE
jgi:uncharacterized protein